MDTPGAVLRRPEVAAFLADHPRGVLAWLDADGSPRQVPVWIAADADRLLFNGPTGRDWPTRLLTERRVSLLVADDDRALECWGTAEVDTDPARARDLVLALTRRVYPDTSRPEMTQDLFRGDRLAVFSLVPAGSRTTGLGR